MSNVQIGCWSSEEQMIRYFWLLSDEVTVREITEYQWRKIVKREWRKSGNTKLLMRIHDGEVDIRKGDRFVYVPLVQLKGVLSS